MKILSIVGQKNAGKTTLVVALARELTRQGRRVMTIKHATHPALVDREGTDSFRHFHEGLADRTLIAAPDQRILFERAPDTADPADLARRYLSDADIVLVEGFRSFPLPKVEVHRTSLDRPTIYQPDLPNASEWIAILTDGVGLPGVECRVLRMVDTMWLTVLTGLVWEQAKVLDP
jgi:molybdopterin-guanine dinucleotide biosynthesis protein B